MTARRRTQTPAAAAPVEEPLRDWLDDTIAAAEHESRLAEAQRCELHLTGPTDEQLTALACHAVYPAVAR